jgi:aminodeoxyfutalosine deaminase
MGELPGAPVRSVSAPWVWAGRRAGLIREGAVVLDATDRIVDVGPRLRVIGPGAEERSDGLLLPALVNAHTHLELSALAGRAPGGEGLVKWVGRLMSAPRDDDAPAAIAAAATALVAAGTAAVGDVGNGVAAIPALAAAGLGGLFFHELVGSRQDRTGDALADAERERAAITWPANLAWVPAPHAPYSVGPELFRRIFAAAAGAGHPTSVHVAEDPDELALLRDGTGAWASVLDGLGVPAGSRTPGLAPVAYLASLGAFAGPHPPLLVHMVHATDEDRRLARQHQATAVLCPRSNLHVGGRLPDVPALLADGVRIALGTDSLASVPDVSLWGEIAALAAAHPELPPETWLHAATSAGAHALALPSLGTLTPGKRPGLIAVPLVDGGAPLPALVRTLPLSITWHARPSIPDSP